MKNFKNPTRNQREIMEKNGLDSRNWYVVKDLPSSLEIISKVAIRKNSTKTKIINK